MPGRPFSSRLTAQFGIPNCTCNKQDSQTAIEAESEIDAVGYTDLMMQVIDKEFDIIIIIMSSHR